MEQTNSERELETVCALDGIEIENGTLNDIAQATAAHIAPATVKGLTQQGWPTVKHMVPLEARPYFNVKDDLSVKEGIIMKGSGYVIPTSLRQQRLQRLHEAHMGTEATVRLARCRVYWQGINGQIRDIVSSCDICLTH